MARKRQTGRAVAMLLTLVMMFSILLPSWALAADAEKQGGNQTAQLYQVGTTMPLSNVTVLNKATTYIGWEGQEYFLNRIEDVYDISEDKDVQIQVKFAAGMNAYTPDLWKNNGMRYLNLYNAETGELVANYRDENVAEGGQNSSGAYQIAYGTVGKYAANEAGILYTIPREALNYETTYWLVMGSATCGNNNSKMLYAPIFYEFTTSNENGEGAVKEVNQPQQHDITVVVNKGEDDSTTEVTFQRLKEQLGKYEPGEAITQSVAGQIIPFKVAATEGLEYTVTIIDSQGNEVPVAEYIEGGPNASNFGDIRFTMPNDDVTITVTTEEYVEQVGSEAEMQGGNLQAQLYQVGTDSTPLANVSVLKEVTSYINGEGQEYFLNRIEDVYDISGEKDVQIQVKFGSGVNNFNPEAWKTNGMRYLNLYNAETGELVANYRDENVAEGGQNSSGAYQIAYGTVGDYAVNKAGILYTIPHEALNYETTYWLVMGSATCGNNNSKMLYAPIFYEFTTSDENGEGSVGTMDLPQQHDITVVVNRDEDDTTTEVTFQRLKEQLGKYEPGEAITQSVAGQIIPFKVAATEGSEYTVTIIDSQGNEVPVVEFVEGGPASGDFGDIRFTMPNDDVTIIVTTEEYIPLDAPALSSSSTRVNRDVTITFEDDEAWRAAIRQITVNDEVIADDTVEAGKIIIPGEHFTKTGKYTITVSAIGYADAIVTQTVRSSGGSSSGGSSSSSTKEYTLTFDTNGGSNITAVKEAANSKIDLSDYKPTREGYTFAGWYADADLTKAISSITLTENTTVYAKWTQSATGLPFNDVAADAWYFNAVKYAYENGLMNGTDATIFSANANTTRGMIVTILYRQAGSPTVAESSGFADVAASAYYANPVAWAAANGVVKGYSETQFGPNDNITREQLAQILYGYAKLQGQDVSGTADLSKFADGAQVSDWAEVAVQWAVSAELMQGDDNGLLNPKGTATRAEVATMLQRFLAE